MINATDKEESIDAMHGQGIKNAERLIAAIEKRHSAISKYFFNEEGNKPMNKYSMLAERVMPRMLERGTTVLPVHDSFIVGNSYADELEEIMRQEFETLFEVIAQLKSKKSVADERTEKFKGDELLTCDYAVPDIEELFEEMSWERTIWGY